jgi:hypothetical protein
MRNLSTFSKVMVGFIAGAFIAGSVAVAVTPDMPPTRSVSIIEPKPSIQQLMEVAPKPELLWRLQVLGLM